MDWMPVNGGILKCSLIAWLQKCQPSLDAIFHTAICMSLLVIYVQPIPCLVSHIGKAHAGKTTTTIVFMISGGGKMTPIRMIMISSLAGKYSFYESFYMAASYLP